jgi:hypothetical protein
MTAPIFFQIGPFTTTIAVGAKNRPTFFDHPAVADNLPGPAAKGKATVAAPQPLRRPGEPLP